MHDVAVVGVLQRPGPLQHDGAGRLAPVAVTAGVQVGRLRIVQSPYLGRLTQQLPYLFCDERHQWVQQPQQAIERVCQHPLGDGPLIATAIHDGHEVREELKSLMAINEADLAAITVLTRSVGAVAIDRIGRIAAGAWLAASPGTDPGVPAITTAEVETLERARRRVEQGEDVVIILDSITRLARAHNRVDKGSGRTLSGGLDATAMERPKRFLGSARNIDPRQGGGPRTPSRSARPSCRPVCLGSWSARLRSCRGPGSPTCR